MHVAAAHTVGAHDENSMPTVAMGQVA